MWNSIEKFEDENQNVIKLVFTSENAVAESVLYRYPDYETRTVICCSVQSGCPIGCRFCGSGNYFVKNLNYTDILGQIEASMALTGIPAYKIKRLQIMFMSMGEPMLNFAQLSEALCILYDIYPQAELLISTMPPAVSYMPLYDLSTKIPNIGLQFSIHESTDEGRNKLIPFEKKLKLDEIAVIGETWWVVTGRHPFINYCAHEGNSSTEDANRIKDLFDPKYYNAMVSVICEKSEGLPSTNQHQRDLATNFASLLVERGFNVRVFDPAGQDTVGGGCGQLWYVQDWMRCHPTLARPTAGYGKPEIHAPRA